MSSYSNENFRISRTAILTALHLPEKIPVGQTGSWDNVVVDIGYGWELTDPTKPRKCLTLPNVRLTAKGVANRIRVTCPVCCIAEVRFSCLHQHAGSKKCKALEAYRKQASHEEEMEELREAADRMEVPAGSEAFVCEKCKSISLSAGDGCNNCGAGYIDEDEDDMPPEDNDPMHDMDGGYYHAPTPELPEDNIPIELIDNSGLPFGAIPETMNRNVSPIVAYTAECFRSMRGK